MGSFVLHNAMNAAGVNPFEMTIITMTIQMITRTTVIIIKYATFLQSGSFLGKLITTYTMRFEIFIHAVDDSRCRVSSIPYTPTPSLTDNLEPKNTGDKGPPWLIKLFLLAIVFFVSKNYKWKVMLTITGDNASNNESMRV